MKKMENQKKAKAKKLTKKEEEKKAAAEKQKQKAELEEKLQMTVKKSNKKVSEENSAFIVTESGVMEVEKTKEKPTWKQKANINAIKEVAKAKNKFEELIKSDTRSRRSTLCRWTIIWWSRRTPQKFFVCPSAHVGV